MPGSLRPPTRLVPAIRRFDADVDRAFNRLRGNPRSDRLFYVASELGDFALIWHLAGAARALRHPDSTRDLVRFSAVMGAESVLVNGGIKSLFRRQRPAHEGNRPHRLRKPHSSSFPSGHASAAFLAASLLSEGNRASLPIYAAAGVVASSRVYVRIHHASDVLAGAALGMALGAVMRRRRPRTR